MVINGFILRIICLCQCFSIDSSENIKQLTSISCKIVKNSLLKLIKKNTY